MLTAAAPLRRKIAGKSLKKSAERFGVDPRHRRDCAVTASAATGVRFSHSSSSSADDSDEGHIRYHSFKPISIVSYSSCSPSSSASALLRRTLATASLGPAAANYAVPSLAGAPLQLQQQLRCLTSGPSYRSSTTAAHLQAGSSFSSKTPADAEGGGHEGLDDGYDDLDERDHDDDGQSRYESARERGRAVAKRGRAAANTGAKAAKKGALSMRDMVQKFGWTALGTYFGLYFSTVGGIFAGIDSGLLDPASVLSATSWLHGGGAEGGDAAEAKSTVEILSHILEGWEWTKPYADSVAENPHIANLGIAWLATKFTEPIRLMLTFAIVPRVHRLLGREIIEDGTEEHAGDKKQ